MKIEYQNKQTTLYFREIEEGTVFISGDGDVCMKTSHFKDSDSNSIEESDAVILETGELVFFEGYEFVTLPVNAKLVIE